MKLLYLHQYFTFPETSGGTRSYDLSKKFVELGIDVTILTSSSTLKNMSFSKRWTYFEREGIKFWVLKNTYSHKMSIFRRIISFLHFIFFASFKLLFLKGDLVLATSTPLTIVVPAILKKWFTGTPYIFEVRDVWPEGPIQQGYIKNKLIIRLLRSFEKYIYLNACYVIPLSIGMKKDIRSRVDVKNLEVIPNISEINRFQNIDKTIKPDLDFSFENRKVILYAGTLGPVNDIMYVAKLAEKMFAYNKQIVFLILGEGREKNKIVKFCEEKNILNENIFFHKPISKDDLPYVYNQACMGSSFVWDYKIKWDNSANKFFDTLAAAKPVLINYQGWQSDVIKEKQCGFVMPYNFDKTDVVKLSDYIMSYEKTELHGRNALLAAEDYSLDNAVKKYLKVFESVNVNMA